MHSHFHSNVQFQREKNNNSLVTIFKLGASTTMPIWSSGK